MGGVEGGEGGGEEVRWCGLLGKSLLRGGRVEGGVGGEDLRVRFGGGTLSSCGLFGSFSGRLNNGCRRVFNRSFQCCVSSA